MARLKISVLGCGWLGLPLAAALVMEGHEVNGSTTHREKLPELSKAGINPFLLNLTPEIEGNGDFFRCDILIINLPPRNKDQQPDFHEKQLLAVRRAALFHSVSKVIFISSTAVYPDLNREVTEEDAREEMLSRGGVSLLRMEQIFSHHPSFRTTVIRFGGLYGPDRHPGRFLGGKKGLSGADNPVNMIHQDDCIGVITAIIDQNIWGEAFNACSPNHPARKVFYEKAARELGADCPHFSDKPADFKFVSSKKLVDSTGYIFIH